jgi:hypothetical protein
MCIPAAAVALALTAGQAVTSYMSQRQSAKAQDAAIKQNYEVNQGRVNAQAKQINDASREEMSERSRQAMIERGRLQVVAGESGLSGFDREVNNTFYSEGTDIATMENNRRNRIGQLNVESQMGGASANSQLASVRRPSLLGTGLQIAAAGANYQAAQEKKKGG